MHRLGFSLEEAVRILNLMSPPDAPRFIVRQMDNHPFIVDTKPPSQTG
jgi:hypothetical protein